jgi:uncharacterized protein (DUF736 family)
MNTNTNTNNSKTDWSKRDVGALWKREGKSQKYLSGYVKIESTGEEIKVVVFANKNKNDNAKAPDYRIYVSAPLETQGSVKPVASKQTAPAIIAPKNVQKVVAEDEDLL